MFTAITAETGVPIATDIIRAVIETFNDKKIISYNSTLRENIKLIDFKIISYKAFLMFQCFAMITVAAGKIQVTIFPFCISIFLQISTGTAA